MAAPAQRQARPALSASVEMVYRFQSRQPEELVMRRSACALRESRRRVTSGRLKRQSTPSSNPTRPRPVSFGERDRSVDQTEHAVETHHFKDPCSSFARNGRLTRFRGTQRLPQRSRDGGRSRGLPGRFRRGTEAVPTARA